jgi:hypothetical protein
MSKAMEDTVTEFYIQRVSSRRVDNQCQVVYVVLNSRCECPRTLRCISYRVCCDQRPKSHVEKFFDVSLYMPDRIGIDINTHSPRPSTSVARQSS